MNERIMDLCIYMSIDLPESHLFTYQIVFVHIRFIHMCVLVGSVCVYARVHVLHTRHVAFRNDTGL